MKKYLLILGAVAGAVFTTGPAWAVDDLRACFDNLNFVDPYIPPANEFESRRTLIYKTNVCSGRIRIRATMTILPGATVVSSIFSPTVELDGLYPYTTDQVYRAQTTGNRWAWTAFTFTYEWAGARGTAPQLPDPPPYLDSIVQRTKLAPGGSLRSFNQKYVLRMQPDGNLVLYNDQTKTAIWDTHTQYYPGAYAVFQADGNLVVFDAGGQMRWASGSSYNGISARLTVGNDGNMRIVQPENYWWNTQTYVSSYSAPSAPVGQSLWPVGSVLNRTSGDFLQSPNGENRLEMTADGDLVLTRKGVMTWNSKTGGRGKYARMQEDGNVVVYAGNFDEDPVWNSGSWGHPGASVLVQDDGNVVLYTWKTIYETFTTGK